MSYSSPLKNLPDFFRRQNLEKTLETLRQPAAIAVIASIGAHGLFFAALPLLTAESKPLDLQKTVQVVELTPQEQSRLPQFTSPLTSKDTLPPIGKTPTSKSAKSANPPNPLAPPDEDSSLYKFPLIPPPPNINLPPIFQPPPILNLKPPSFTINPEVIPAPKPTKSAEPVRPPLAPTISTDTPSTPASPPAPVRSDKIPPAAIARLQELQRAATDRYATEGETEEQGTKNLSVWLAQVKDKDEPFYNELLDSRKVQEISAKYPGEACSAKLSRIAAVGLILTPDGKVISQPELLQRTGSKSLDKAALEAANASIAELKVAEKPRLYLLRVPFEYKAENCTAAPAEQTPPS